MRVVATAGHVDHGKSSLVRSLTGTDPDRLEEERRRGLTIDLGFAHATLPGGEDVSFVDVPGHVRFLRNMLAGVGGVDACLFVVAATEGWKPQSEEHLRILQLVGVQHGLVVLTKADLVDDDWLALQALDVRDRLAGTFLADAEIVPVSTVTGDGLDAMREALARLVQRTPQSTDRDRPRLWIDRVFAAKGSGTVVTGTLTGGRLAVDDLLRAGAHDVRVRGLQVHGAKVDHVGPGHRVAVNLAGVDHTALQRGDALVRAHQWRPTRRFDATLTVLPTLDHQVSRRGAYLAYIGSGELPVRVRVLGSETLAPGAQGFVRLHLDEHQPPVPLVPGDRYVLRESGRDETIGGGEVLDVAPVLPASKARPDRSVQRVVAERGWVEADELTALTGAQVAPTLGRWVVAPDALAAMTDNVAGKVAAAGPLGLETATLDERERAVLATLDGIQVDGGRARPAVQTDPLADHPLLATLAAGGWAPPDPTGVDRAELREMIRRGLLVERDGIVFHPSAIQTAALAAARLLASAPDGFTMSQFREALDVSRKYALPLANELDARGITRRRGDVRIGGPRLPG
ncbi:MAG TPA: selenocysteine-specific translation elongation factor [Ilumatobacteraceae bacterium]|nr:selenocysteine-specific translation elongation factor [Ilumatobacteraceae bacterium]